MAAEVIYKAAAEAEIEIAFREYESQQSGLGTQFLDELHRIEGHLRLNPALYQRIDGDLRRAVLRRFPYGLFYVIDDEQVSILACLHLRRDPRSRADLVSR
ncbi:MAG: type II toxin-antitoxin system RelE/ParE family toxin [Reyranella sp.]|uniref:type II toxin-antitoxin system RelE/ParE family toxin n=1 Tax=Reyranella sp. TaxID=1929291 RepID=UPI00122BBC8F|nr:type II toxin-antitoxin system RelE/ParE family toxin [Reyranella sp.]TAJ40880.1 MAG: type II toxin-antitoxin system RelE/ParE family toxin [Reyranella sp.]